MDETDRRLAGILAADVVDYSAMVGVDEPGTLARVRTLRTDLIEPLAATHGGRLFKTTGDGFFLSFASAVQALRCAIAIQGMLRSQPDGLRLRIGVHQGEVVPEGDDLVGDGVILAARLEPLAEAGGICISSRVREDAAGKMPLEVDDLGEPPLKNIRGKIRVFRVRLGSPDVAPSGSAGTPSMLALPDKPSIAVLAFTNMSNDPEQEYFSDGVAEDIITELSRSRALFVIARNSTFTYKGRAVDLRQVGRELGVRYVLEGSVRRSGSNIRVSARLVDAEAGTPIWTERYDRQLADVFALQDEITNAVASALEPAISQGERDRAFRKDLMTLSAWDAYHRGLWHYAKTTHDNNEEARTYFLRAIELDPSFSSAYQALAYTYADDAALYFSRSLQDAVRLGSSAATQAVAFDPSDAGAYAVLGYLRVGAGAVEDALAQAEIALGLNRNCATAFRVKGLCLTFLGRPREGIEALQIGLRLNPRDPRSGWARNILAIAHYFLGEYHSTVDECRHALRISPGDRAAYRWLAAALGQLGQTAEAQKVIGEATAAFAHRLSFDEYAKRCWPWEREEDHNHLLEGLRKAGWVG